MQKDITTAASIAIDELRHSCGTLSYYTGALSSMRDLIIRHSDELKIDDDTAMGLLRAIDSMSADFTALAKSPAADVDEKEADADEDDAELKAIHVGVRVRQCLDRTSDALACGDAALALFEFPLENPTPEVLAMLQATEALRRACDRFRTVLDIIQTATA